MKPYPHKQNHLQLCVLMRSLEGSWHWDALPLIESTVCVLLCIAMHTWWFLNPLPLNFRAFNMVCWHLSVVTAFGGACYSAHTSPPGAGYLVGILNLENRVFDSGKLSYSCNAFFFFFFNILLPVWALVLSTASLSDPPFFFLHPFFCLSKTWPPFIFCHFLQTFSLYLWVTPFVFLYYYSV